MVVLHILVKRSEQFYFCELSPQIINVFKNPSCHIKCTAFLDHILLLFLTFAALNCNSFDLPHDDFYQSPSLAPSVNKFLSWHFPFQVATTRITPSSSSQGLGQKTKQDLLKEESEKMKVFAQQLRSKPQFIAVFKVCNIISSDNRQQLKSKPSVHCCLQGGPA